MTYSSNDLKNALERNGFLVHSTQEEDEFKALDAEVVIDPGHNDPAQKTTYRAVVHIDYTGETPEFGLTLEPFHTKRKHSAFRHIGYFPTFEGLLRALTKVRPGAATA